MQIFSKVKVYDFMRIRYGSLAVSAILFFGSVFLIFTKGLNFGIDFSGGTLVQVKYEQNAPLDKIRESLNSSNLFKGISVTEFGSSQEIVIRFSDVSSNVGTDVGASVSNVLKDTGNFEVRRVDIVGPKVGGELREKGFMALLISFVAVLLYIAWRFEWRFALATITAEIHDIVICVGAVSLFDIDVNLDTLAAVLTVLGYSLNDTIIIFDRIREGIKNSRTANIVGIINESVSATLSRTILTSGTTMLTVLVLFFFGGDMIHDFSFVLAVGILAGTISSIYIASPFLIWFNFNVENFRAMQAAKAKAKKERERERALYEKGVV